MESSLTGFYKATVTKVIMIACGLSTLAVSSRRGSKFCSLSYQALFVDHEFWRLLTSNIVVDSSSELIVGLFLLYCFRVFERQISSNKFTMFALFSAAVSTATQLTVSLLFTDPKQSLSPGPYALIFASLVQFYSDFPSTMSISVANVPLLSDKTIVYLAALQILVSSWKRSLIPGLSGILAGILYRMNILGIRKAKFPPAMVSSACQFFKPLISQPNVQAAARPVNAVVQPSLEGLRALESMGFDRDSAARALVMCNNDIASATTYLLEGQTL